MKIEITEALWLDERQDYTLGELADLSGLTETEVHQLMEYDALTPAGPRAAAARFSADCLITARTACRLRDDFDLDAGGLALTLTLLNRIRELEAEVRALQAQFPHRYR